MKYTYEGFYEEDTVGTLYSFVKDDGSEDFFDIYEDSSGKGFIFIYYESGELIHIHYMTDFEGLMEEYIPNFIKNL